MRGKFTTRIFSSLNLATTVVLLGALFILVNFVASRRSARWDLTKERVTALSPLTRQTLKALREPVSVVVFYQPAHRLYDMVRDQLKEYASASDKLKVEFVDPEQDIARAKQLVKEFQIDDLNVVVFSAGTKHKHLSDTELAEYDYSSMAFGAQPRVKAFKGEEAFTSAILSVTQTTQPLVWITTGHGEHPLDQEEPEGLSGLKRLFEQHNLLVKEITLLQQPSIPDEVKLVVIPGATHRITEQELALLSAYLQHGGRLLALVDPMQDTGLDGLLEQWGIVLGNNIVVDPARQLPFVSAANLFVTTYTQHPIVEKMKTLMTLFPLARSVTPTQPAPPGVTVSALAFTSEEGWGETTTSVSRFQFDPKTDLKGPVSIAVAAERNEPIRTRLVVVGDSDFVVNAQLHNAGNGDLFMGAVHWLIEQEQLIGIGPKSVEAIKLHLTEGQLAVVFWTSFLGLPSLCGILGVLMWWLRRQ